MAQSFLWSDLVGGASSNVVTANSNTAGYVGYCQPSGPWPPIPIPTYQEKPPMRGLFEVFIVDYRATKIVAHLHVIGADEQYVRLAALLEAKIKPDDLDAYDIIVRHLGHVRTDIKRDEPKDK